MVSICSFDVTVSPFVDQTSGTLQTRQIWTEAFPLIGLILLFGALALVPYAQVSFGPPGYVIESVLMVLIQFILLVGSGIILMYIIARGIQLSNG